MHRRRYFIIIIRLHRYGLSRWHSNEPQRRWGLSQRICQEESLVGVYWMVVGISGSRRPTDLICCYCYPFRTFCSSKAKAQLLLFVRFLRDQPTFHAGAASYLDVVAAQHGTVCPAKQKQTNNVVNIMGPGMPRRECNRGQWPRGRRTNRFALCPRLLSLSLHSSSFAKRTRNPITLIISVPLSLITGRCTINGCMPLSDSKLSLVKLKAKVSSRWLRHKVTREVCCCVKLCCI